MQEDIIGEVKRHAFYLKPGEKRPVVVCQHGLEGTPKDVVDRLVKSVQAALADPAVRKRLETLGFVIFPADQQNPAALQAYNKAELDKWWPVIKAAGIKAGD